MFKLNENCCLFLIFSTFPPGHIVVFSDQSGMDASGQVMLGTMDVHHQWTKVTLQRCWCCHRYSVFAFCFLTLPLAMCVQLFEQLSSYRSLQQQTNWLKERISHLLGGTRVISLEGLAPVQPIAEHYSTLSIFHKSLMSQRLHLHPRSLQGLTMVLEKYAVTLPTEDLKYKTHCWVHYVKMCLLCQSQRPH